MTDKPHAHAKAIGIILMGSLLFLMFAGAASIWLSDQNSQSAAPSAPINLRYVNAGHYLACPSQSDIEALGKFAVEKDTQAAMGLIAQGRCFNLDPGQRVFQEDFTWDGLVKIRIEGSDQTAWTYREAITSDEPAGAQQAQVTNVAAATRMDHTPDVGLGATIEALEKAWNKGYRRAFDKGSGDEIVWLGSSEESHIDYQAAFNFSDPPRVGDIEGGAKGMFGALAGEEPGASEFFSQIKRLTPVDSKIVAEYIRKDRFSHEVIYEFESNWIKALPDIRQAPIYKNDKKNVGRFVLEVLYDPSRPDRISAFTLSLGSKSTYTARPGFVAVPNIHNPLIRELHPMATKPKPVTTRKKNPAAYTESEVQRPSAAQVMQILRGSQR